MLQDDVATDKEIDSEAFENSIGRSFCVNAAQRNDGRVPARPRVTGCLLE
jgi:hypothetical protein